MGVQETRLRKQDRMGHRREFGMIPTERDMSMKTCQTFMSLLSTKLLTLDLLSLNGCDYRPSPL